MQQYNYVAVIEEHLKSLNDDEFVETTKRLLKKLNQETSIDEGSINVLATEGLLHDSIFYRTVALQSNKPVKINSLIPKDKKKFSFVTILTNKIEMFDAKTKSTLSTYLPHVVFNYWGVNDLSTKIAAFELEEIKQILSDSASLLIAYLETSFDESRNRQILSKIFDFLFNTPIPDDFKIPKDEDGKLIHIDKKIPLNFGKHQYRAVRELYILCFSNILLVEGFIKYQLAVDRRPTDALLAKIHANYCTLKGVRDRRVRVVDFKIIEELAKSLLPPNLIDDTEYVYHAKAIVLFFFEACEYGVKYEAEPASLFEKEK